MVMALSLVVAFVLLVAAPASAQLTDVTQTPNLENEGIHKSLSQQIGAGRGDALTPGSSLYLIRRDPFRSIRRGRQLFQRKFTIAQGAGPRSRDGIHDDINSDPSPGAGLVDSCAGCHGRPRGSAGFGGDVFTRPDSRDAPHLFGLGLVEMLADEMTTDLRVSRAEAVRQATRARRSVTLPLAAKGTRYGRITARADGTLDTSGVQGVDPDLRVRPFFHHGGEFSIRGFSVGAFNDEMGSNRPMPTWSSRRRAGASSRRRGSCSTAASTASKCRALRTRRPTTTSTARSTRCRPPSSITWSSTC